MLARGIRSYHRPTEILEVERPRRFATKFGSWVLRGRSSATFEPDGDGTLVSWELSYRDTLSAVTQAHIHFGAPAISGGIVVFLCTNLGNAPVGAQLCPAAPATITGTFTAADVVSVGTAGAQGIAPGELAEVLRAIRAGAAYVNVHTVGFTGGEIRGQLDRGHDDH